VSPALRALVTVRIQAQFELAAAANEVSEAVELSNRSRYLAESLYTRHSLGEEELRAAIRQQPINPVLVSALRALHAERRILLDESLVRLDADREVEAQARTKLGLVRHRDEAFSRALKNARRQHELAVQAAELDEAGDLWLRRQREDTT
jgi:hypothetical protein